METITLRCEQDDALSYDRNSHEVILERETEDSWYGRPVANPNCPTLEYPKFAWSKNE